MTGDLVLAGPSSGALALRPEQTEWSPAQAAALRQLGLADAPEGDLAVFMHVCQRTGLDPFTKQIYMIKRWDSQAQSSKYTIQTAIDGLRVIADRRNKPGHDMEYLGPVGPEWCGDDGRWVDVWVSEKPPAAARVGVLRRGWKEPAWGVALFREYAQYKSGGALTAMWREKQAHMIAKCAEALALRKAFPHDLAGLLTPEEAAREEAEARGPLVVEQAPPPALSVAELTGGVPGEDLAAGASPDGGRMLPAQQKRLLEARREVEVDEWWPWASGVVGRPVKSYGHLTAGDGDLLIAALAALATVQANAAAAEQPDPPADEETPQQ